MGLDPSWLSTLSSPLSCARAVLTLAGPPWYNSGMAKISMTPAGRFGQLFAAAIQKKALSLKAVADAGEITYEQARKLYIGTSSPSSLLLKELCKLLSIDLKAAQEAATADKMERRYGAAGLKVRGQDPRLSALNAVSSMLTDAEIAMLVSMAQTLIQSRKSA